jgi:hypothetical protein
MIALTLNSKKGTNNTSHNLIPTNFPTSFIVNVTTAGVSGGNSIIINTNYLIKPGDTFTYATVSYTITYVTITGTFYTTLGITPAFSASSIVPIGGLIITPCAHSSSLGYAIASLSCGSSHPIGSSNIPLKNILGLSMFSNLINCQVLVGTDSTVYKVTNIITNQSNNNVGSYLAITPPLASATASDVRVIFYAKTYNNITYNIDSSIFKNSRKYELSFSFSSSPMVFNQYSKIPLVYINLNSSSTHESNIIYNTDSITQLNFLGFLKTNLIYNSANSSDVNSLGNNNTQYCSLVADPSNIPIIINKPTSNNITITVVNEDGTPFYDCSNYGIMQPYVISLYFKEYHETKDFSNLLIR